MTVNQRQERGRAQRAISDEEKQQREAKIIDAARGLLMQKGFHAVNINEIAQAAKLAKGTLYLYFSTKEELFLSLFEREIEAWFVAIVQTMSAQPSSIPAESAAALLVDSLIDRPHLTRLLALSAIILEHNISYERAHAHKTWLFGRVAEVGECLEAALELQPGQGTHLLLRLSVFVMGMEGMAHPSPVSAEVYANVPELAALDYRQELYDLTRLVIQSYR